MGLGVTPSCRTTNRPRMRASIHSAALAWPQGQLSQELRGCSPLGSPFGWWLLMTSNVQFQSLRGVTVWSLWENNDVWLHYAALQHPMELTDFFRTLLLNILWNPELKPQFAQAQFFQSAFVSATCAEALGQSRHKRSLNIFGEWPPAPHSESRTQSLVGPSSARPTGLSFWSLKFPWVSLCFIMFRYVSLYNSGVLWTMDAHGSKMIGFILILGWTNGTEVPKMVTMPPTPKA